MLCMVTTGSPQTKRSKTAWIEIFVDRIFEGWEGGFCLKLPLVRDFLLAPVLFHEIGHHIHARFDPNSKSGKMWLTGGK
jgi:hypothetical protein